MNLILLYCTTLALSSYSAYKIGNYVGVKREVKRRRLAKRKKIVRE
jgi:hypothetical protein